MANKPIPCPYCKNIPAEGSACPYCGVPIGYSYASFVCGQTMKPVCVGELKITDRYLILQTSTAKKEAAKGIGNIFVGLAGGLVGSLAVGAAEESKRKKMPYSFFDLREIKKIIYPYLNNTFRQPVALKIVNLDGSDLIIYHHSRTPKQNIADAAAVSGFFAQAGVPIEDGNGRNYGSVFCEHPFVDAKALRLRVCASAASFVRLTDDQFVAQPIAAVCEAEPQQIPEPQKVLEPAASDAVPPVFVQPIEIPTEADVPHEPEAATDSPTDGFPVSGPEPEIAPSEAPYEANDRRSDLPFGFSRPSFAPTQEQPAESPQQSTDVPSEASAETPTDKKLCPRCGTQVGIAAKFCMHCGFAFPQDEPSPKTSWNIDEWKRSW